MPRKRSEAVNNARTPAQRALDAAVAEQLAEDAERLRRTLLAQPGMTPKKLAKQEAKSRREFARKKAKAFAKWDAASPEWRARQAEKILAFDRLYDKNAKMPAAEDLPWHYFVHRLAKEFKPEPYVPPTWEEHVATIDARRAQRVATAPATATEPEPAPVESPEPPKRRRARLPIVTIVDPRLRDDDDEWEWV